MARTTSSGPSTGVQLPVMEQVMRRDTEYQVMAFGPQYFRGVMWGALFSGIGTALLTRRLYKHLRLQVEGTKTKMSLFNVDPYRASGMYACGMTTTLKFIKFVLSRGRYNEFLWDDYYAQKALEEAERDEASGQVVSEEVQKYRQVILIRAAAQRMREEAEKTTLDAYHPSKHEPYPNSESSSIGTGDTKASPEKLHRMYTPKKLRQDEMPTFADGVSVGIFGTVQDAWYPAKKPADYLNCRAGKF